MSISTILPKKPPKIIYPESDGNPMAENTQQFRWIVTVKEGLEALFAADPDVFVAGDLLWYPVEGHPEIRVAPDALVVFGRPKGDRGSYLQWEEAGVAPQVVFEILSPSNTLGEMTRKFRFYERYGVEEYYVYDPDKGDLNGWLRREEGLDEILQMNGWVSPRLGIRFQIEDLELALYRPDGERFFTYLELVELRAQAHQEAAQAHQEADQARQEAAQARQEADQARKQAKEAESRAQRLAEHLRALGVNPDTQ
jgi:Uma2 family endonuclease